MKYLFVTCHYLKGKGGGIFATRAFVNAFSKIGTVTVMYPYKDGYEAEGLFENVSLIPVKDNRSRFSKLLACYSGTSNRFLPYFEKVLADESPDVVVFDSSDASHHLIEIAKSRGRRIITIHHNFEREYYRDNAAWYLKPAMLYWAGKFERDALRFSNLNLALTESDKFNFLSHYADCGRIEVIGIFQYASTQRPVVPCVCDKINTFAITGNLSAAQSETSIVEWMGKYYPILLDRIPDMRLIVAGKNPSSRLSEILSKYERVDLIPSPESMDLILREADCYICPTSKGSGLKLRVMDGLEFGLPVLCHQISARGYESFVDKGFVQVYYDSDSFKKAVSDILNIQVDRHGLQKDFQNVFYFDSGLRRLKKALKAAGFEI